MKIPSFNELLNITDSRYSFIMLISKRARALIDGEEPLIETDIKKPVSIAIEEAMEGAISFGTKEQEEAQMLKKEARKRIEALRADEEE